MMSRDQTMFANNSYVKIIDFIDSTYWFDYIEDKYCLLTLHCFTYVLNHFIGLLRATDGHARSRYIVCTCRGTPLETLDLIYVNSSTFLSGC